MKDRIKQHKPVAFGAKKTPAQLAQDLKDRRAFSRIDKRHGVITSMKMWLVDRDWDDAHRATADRRKIIGIAPRTQHRTRGGGSRSSANSGDGNSDSDSSGDPDPDPARLLPLPQHPLQLLDQSSLAALLRVSRKTLQNQYSASPGTLPPAIQIPGARGPRWTQQAVQAWLDSRPAHAAHAAKPAPVLAKTRRGVGRPRIAATLAGVVGKGGAS